MSADDRLQNLYIKACKYFSGYSQPLSYFYRNQSYEYFGNVLSQGGVMYTTKKDHSGDAFSPINGRLWGLCFMANNPPKTTSPFGPRRLMVPAERLLDLLCRSEQQPPNLYFADFYCMNYRKTHWVTLVVARPRSGADWFCRRRNLLPLQWTDNPFLYRDQNGDLRVSDDWYLNVEVIFPEDIKLFRNGGRRRNGRRKYRKTIKGSFLTNVNTIGTGHSSTEGMPKSPYCSICNV